MTRVRVQSFTISLDGYGAGLIDELHVAIAPVLLGGGERPFEGVDGQPWATTASGIFFGEGHLYRDQAEGVRRCLSVRVPSSACVVFFADEVHHV